MATEDRAGEPGGERVTRLYGLLRPHLDERQRRLLLGAEALGLGRGGIKAVAEATGCTRTRWAGGYGRRRAGRSRGCGRPAGAGRSWPPPTRAWCRRWRRWWTRGPGGIRCRR